MKTVMSMSESLIDRQVGHVPGSDTTREYTRINDEEVLNEYKKEYGLSEEEEKNPECIIMPRECSSCSSIVSGHRVVMSLKN